MLKLAKEGTIATEGVAGGGGTDPSVAAVTGGTGAFGNARGQVEEKVKSAALSVLVLRLIAYRVGSSPGERSSRTMPLP